MFSPFTETNLCAYKYMSCRSQWPRGLRRRSAAARQLRLGVRIPSEVWIFVCCECCVLLGKGLCDELITRPEESYHLCCVVVCDLEASWMRRPCPTGGCCAQKNIYTYIFLYVILLRNRTASIYTYCTWMDPSFACNKFKYKLILCICNVHQFTN